MGDILYTHRYRQKYFLWKSGKNGPVKTKYESDDPMDLYKYCKD